MSKFEKIIKSIYLGTHLDKFCKMDTHKEKQFMEKEKEISKIKIRNMMVESQLQETRDLIEKIEKHTKKLIAI